MCMITPYRFAYIEDKNHCTHEAPQPESSAPAKPNALQGQIQLPISIQFAKVKASIVVSSGSSNNSFHLQQGFRTFPITSRVFTDNGGADKNTVTWRSSIWTTKPFNIPSRDPFQHQWTNTRQRRQFAPSNPLPARRRLQRDCLQNPIPPLNLATSISIPVRLRTSQYRRHAGVRNAPCLRELCPVLQVGRQTVQDGRVRDRGNATGRSSMAR